MITFAYLFDKTFNKVNDRLFALEVEELKEAIRERDWRGIREEWSDVCLFWVLRIYCQTSRPWLRDLLGALPVLPGLGMYSALKFMRRMDTWAKIAQAHGVFFHKSVLVQGSNFLNPEKVKAAHAKMRGAKPLDWAAIVQILSADGWFVREGREEWLRRTGVRLNLIAQRPE